jgi:hypothetical protein
MGPMLDTAAELKRRQGTRKVANFPSRESALASGYLGKLEMGGDEGSSDVHAILPL